MSTIVSSFNFYTCSLSKFVDSFLKFQAKKCKSCKRDTRDFVKNLLYTKNIPERRFLVTMDVSSLYTNVNRVKGAEVCL